MIEALKCKPTPYTPNAKGFWDDAHIAKHMLTSHVNPNADGATRKHEFVQQSAAWIASLRQGGDLLDLGCGPGIYAELFDSYGFTVTGMDISMQSIAYATESAKRNNKEIQYVHQDYLSLSYEDAFDVVTLIYCDFGVLAPDHRLRLLKKINRALRPGGLLIMDVWTNNWCRDFTEQMTVSYEKGGFWSPEDYVCIKCDRRYGDNVVLEQYNVMTAEHVTTYNIWNEAFDEERLSRLVHVSGFSDVSFYADVCGRERSKEDKVLCLVAKK